MHLGSLNVTYKCFLISPGDPFTLGSEGQGHDSQKNIAGVGLYTLVIVGFF